MGMGEKNGGKRKEGGREVEFPHLFNPTLTTEYHYSAVQQAAILSIVHNFVNDNGVLLFKCAD